MGKLPTNILAVIISMELTLVTFFAYCQIKSIMVVWYMIVAAVVMGFLVAYATMFGFDKLKEVLTELNKQYLISEKGVGEPFTSRPLLHLDRFTHENSGFSASYNIF